MDEPEVHNYPAAESYLSLTVEPAAASRIVAELQAAPTSQFKAKDIFISPPRAGTLPQKLWVRKVGFSGRLLTVDAAGKKKPGNDLLSHRQAAVPSARQGLTSVFGMGTGGTPAP